MRNRRYDRGLASRLGLHIQSAPREIAGFGSSRPVMACWAPGRATLLVWRDRAGTWTFHLAAGAGRSRTGKIPWRLPDDRRGACESAADVCRKMGVWMRTGYFAPWRRGRRKLVINRIPRRQFPDPEEAGKMIRAEERTRAAAWSKFWRGLAGSCVSDLVAHLKSHPAEFDEVVRNNQGEISKLISRGPLPAESGKLVLRQVSNCEGCPDSGACSDVPGGECVRGPLHARFSSTRRPEHG